MKTSTYKEFLLEDLTRIRAFQSYCYQHPYIDSFYRRVVSKNPLQDIVMLLPLCFIIAVSQIGAKHFWVVGINLSSVFLIRKLIEAKRPVELDRTLQPLSDTGAESFGFPSIESHMSVVIFGHIFVMYPYVLLLPLFVAVTVVIGASRVWSRSRFPHQIVASWVTGLVGLYIGTHCCHLMGFHMMKEKHHICCIIGVVFCFLAHFALCAENNDSRIAYVPKKEFVQVLSGIIQSSEESTESFSRDDMDSPTQAAVKENKKTVSQRSQSKRDSFYFLHRTLERRDLKSSMAAARIHSPRYQQYATSEDLKYYRGSKMYPSTTHTP